MQSDPWWGLAMAINVYMVFFLAANPVSFRKYLWVYCLICFGAPALPAIVLVSVRPKGGPIYGNATVRLSSLLGPMKGSDTAIRAIGPFVLVFLFSDSGNPKALVLDRRLVELAPHLHLLHTDMGVHHAVRHHLHRCRLPCVSPAQSAA